MHLRQGDQVESHIQETYFYMCNLIVRTSFIQSKKKLPKNSTLWKCSSALPTNQLVVSVAACLDSTVYLLGLGGGPFTSMFPIGIQECGLHSSGHSIT